METWEWDSLLFQLGEFRDRLPGHIEWYILLHRPFHSKVYTVIRQMGLGELKSPLQCSAENYCFPWSFIPYLLCLRPSASLLPSLWVFMLEYLYLPFRFGSVRSLPVCCTHFSYTLTTVIHCICSLRILRGSMF